MDEKLIEQQYETAREIYAAKGVDTGKAIEEVKRIALSMHCWQGDDVAGFESEAGLSGGGILATGNYPGRARNLEELMRDVEEAYSLIPGRHRLNLHAMYLDDKGQPVERDQIRPEHFDAWIDWAREKAAGLDFNPTCFSHPKADQGFTLASPDESIRRFWIDHCIASRRIAAHMGERLDDVSTCNIWIPDGYKDLPADRKGPRERLAASLDAILDAEVDTAHLRDSVESKLFGIGSECYVVGSHEFYLGYAIRRQIHLCLDAGHFHPTEKIADKLSAVMPYVPGVLLHLSRGVRWDSDHVILLDDDLRQILSEVVRGGYLDRVCIGLDFFDASINRIAAWVIGMRSALKALLTALLEPTHLLREAEERFDFTSRLARMEECKNLPWGAVWNYYCLTQEVPEDESYLDEIARYEKEELSKRG